MALKKTTKRPRTKRPPAKSTRKPAAEPVGDDGLTDRQRLFVEHYLTCWNASEAARLAGYKDPGQAGYENKKKQEIRAIIKNRLAQAAMEADEVLARLSDIAGADMTDFLSPSGRGYKIDLKKASAAGKTHLIRKIKKDRKGIQIELHDAKDALVQLGRHHALFTDLLGGEIETLTPEQIEQRRQERWTKAAPILATMLAKQTQGEAKDGS